MVAAPTGRSRGGLDQKQLITWVNTCRMIFTWLACREPVKTWTTLSVIALLPMLLRAPKALSPIHVGARDLSRLSGLFRRYKIRTFTGRASDVGKRSDNITKGSSRTVSGADGRPVGVTTDINTEVVVTDSFFLTDDKGQAMSFEAAGFEARVGNGHSVSLVWLIKGFSRSGRYLAIFDHTTEEVFYSDRVIRKLLTFPYPPIYVAILILMILPLPVLIFFVIVEWVQRARFKSAGLDALIPVMSERAENVSAQLQPEVS
jgi:hypothetical protein